MNTIHDSISAQEIVPYTGDAPFIFVSYEPSDWPRVKGILALMQHRGIRFWISAGIKPGMERDEVIAEKIEACGFFYAFLSPAYMQSLDCTDELNYARDLGKELVLLYLKPTELTAGIRMRMTRTQSLNLYAYQSDQAFFETLLAVEGIQRFYGIEDQALAKKALPLLEEMEAYYPSHRFFALDGLDPALNDRLAKLCVQTEFESVDELLSAYGFTRIVGEEVSQLRGGIHCIPGEEPAVIQRRLSNALQTLREYYPEGIIGDNLQERHKSAHRRLFALQKWLGYPDLHDFLAAYGFQYLYEVINGRRARSKDEYAGVIEALRAKYSQGCLPTSLMQLSADNPEYSAVLKTMNNNSYALFGCSLKPYLAREGIVRLPVKEPTVRITHLKALEKLQKRYEENPGHGNFEEVREQLAGLYLRINSYGQIYVFSVLECREDLILPWGIDFIREEAFAEQSDLRSIVLPDSCLSIGARCFAGCDALEEITLPATLRVIESETFAGCTALSRVTIPVSVEKICSRAFADCESLEEVQIQNPHCSVYGDAFAGCLYRLPEPNTGDIVFQYTVDKKNRATITGFSGGSARVVVPPVLEGHPVLAIGKGVFTGNEQLREVVLADTISSIPADAFQNCSALERVQLSDTLSKFTSAAFAGCVNLIEVNVPSAMPELKRNVFKDSPVEILHIGAQVRAVDPNAFFRGEYDPATGKLLRGKTVRQIVISPGNTQLKADGSRLYSGDGKILLAEFGSAASCVIPEGVEEIAESAFSKDSFLTEVTLPSTLRKIGAAAFADSGLCSVHFGSALAGIGERAFSYCRDLTEATFSEGLLVIGDQAFEGCPISSIRLPASLRQLGSNAFPILSLYQGEAPQSFEVDLGNPVFHTDGLVLYRQDTDGKAALKAYSRDLWREEDSEAAPLSYKLEDGTTEIAPYAFSRCSNLSSVLLPDSLRQIGEYAFWDCTRLSSIPPLDGIAAAPTAFLGCAVE